MLDFVMEDPAATAGTMASWRMPEIWIRPPIVPVDYLGPVGQPFRPMPAEAVDTPVIDLLERVVRRNPYAVAVQERRDCVLFAELWTAVCHLVRQIEEHPAQEGVVAVLMPPSAARLVAVFACLAAGRVCAPLDPAAAEAQIGAVGAGLLLVSQSTGAIPAGVPTLRVPPFGERLPPSALPGRRLGQDEPALLLFMPGGVVMAHSQRTLLHQVRNAVNSQHIGERDRALCAGPFSGLAGCDAWLAPLLAGASIEMMEGGDEAAVLQTLELRPVTILRVGVARLRRLVRQPGAAAALSSLRLVQAGGEALTRADLSLLQRVLPEPCMVRCHGGAGAAEGIAGFLHDDGGLDPLRVPCGWLIPGWQAAVVDEWGRSCPPGEPGELMLRSRFAALGMWEDGQVVPGPADGEMRRCTTGDIVRMGADGMVVVLGRKERAAGRRIHPGKAAIEAVLEVLG